MNSQLPSEEKPIPLNHDEAFQLACLKRPDSNMARCYIDLVEAIRAWRDAPTEDEDHKAANRLMDAIRFLGAP